MTYAQIVCLIFTGISFFSLGMCVRDEKEIQFGIAFWLIILGLTGVFWK